jgi:hypothetical protein
VPSAWSAINWLIDNPAVLQSVVATLIFSGAHPGRGLRNVSEAHAMVEYGRSLVEQPPPAGRCGMSWSCGIAACSWYDM